MKVKTSELTGKALDWVVTYLWIKVIEDTGEYIKPWWKTQVLESHHADPYSSEWLWGGPLIEQEKLSVGPELKGGDWYGDWRCVCLSWEGVQYADESGPTPLIAAMRCYVASKLGDEVDVPEELL
jgi:hypothetical protein